MEEKYIKEGASVAWLSYLGLLILVPILTQKDNPYTKFHVKQGLVLLIAGIAWSFLQFLFFAIRPIGFFISLGAWFFFFILTIMGIINAVSGKTNELPLIGKFAEKINI